MHAYAGPGRRQREQEAAGGDLDVVGVRAERDQRSDPGGRQAEHEL
jgi:hypothetical protein